MSSTVRLPTAIPHGRTARRLEWPFLPPDLRAAIERRCGSPVVDAHTQRSGFTPGFASVLVCEDGSRHFVKAASVKAQRMFAEAYRVEARKLAALPEGVPAPRLLWTLEEDWVVLGIEHVASRQPARPWTVPDLDACLDSLETVAAALTPVPEALALDGFADELAGFPAYWERLHTLPGGLARVEEAAALAARFGEVTAGQTVVHSDLRDDNVLLDPDGRAWFCDWNFPVAGADWIDSLLMLIGPRGDGLDVEEVIRRRPLLRDVPAESVDIVLALVTGYFLASAQDPVPPTSPHIRDHQRWQGEVCWAWLGERRGW
ncbi:phosphotransferase [Nocardioides euryhalodurans]|uniref:Aminoglycoside phosphotransferase domain-containing protein n=1 Tax=Nocardioides euryhalodurans TaxID=2518370 RepID=A0A4P7GIW9_9ACTN|nr:phosphotransferase [Nocardioides euryhalodurans]QBR91654.1 hypothetical protein EXE57_04770 [Nocardioides euryhalodurans]